MRVMYQTMRYPFAVSNLIKVVSQWLRSMSGTSTGKYLSKNKNWFLNLEWRRYLSPPPPPILK